VVGKFTACPSHADNAQLEQDFLKRAEAEQDNYDKGVRISSAPTSDDHDELPRPRPVTREMAQGGRDPWDGE